MELPLKLQKKEFKELPAWWTHGDLETVVCQRQHGSASLFLTLTRVSLPSGHSWIISLRNRLVIYWVKSSLNSVSHSSKLIKAKEGWGHGNLWFMASLLEAQATTWVCDWHLKLGRGILVELSPPLTCGIECYFQVHNIRVELNYRTPAGVPTIGWWCVGREPAPLPEGWNWCPIHFYLTNQFFLQSFPSQLWQLHFPSYLAPNLRVILDSSPLTLKSSFPANPFNSSLSEFDHFPPPLLAPAWQKPPSFLDYCIALRLVP